MEAVAPPRGSDAATNAEVIGAIRLAMEGSTDDASRVRLIDTLLDYAPPTDPGDTRSPKMLIETIQALGGELTVPVD